MSTFSVSNVLDSGPGSLREAIQAANSALGADLIRFSPAARDGTITLTSGELSITDDLTLNGPGVNRLTISGNDASRIFSVSGSETDVEILDLTIAHGRATGTTVAGPVGPVTLGGALLNTGARVALSHVSMDNNQAVGIIAQGGAIANMFGARLMVTDSTFTTNRAAGTMFGSGGAIVNEGSESVLVLDHSTFTGNQASASLGAGPLINQGNAVAGAVKNSAGGQATVLHTTFEDNFARGGNGADGGPGQKGGDAGFGVAGALENAWYGLVGSSASSTMTVAYGTFLSNQALGGTGGTGGAGAAGGIGRGGVGGVISNAGSTLAISHSTFLGNQALAGSGGNGGAGGNGGVGGFGAGGAINSGNPTGGVAVFATLHVSDCLFQGNVATAGAGGSGGSGGSGGEGRGSAISNGSSTLTVSRSAFLGNHALGGNGGNGDNGGAGGGGGNGSGGAISNGPGSTVVPVRATLHVSDSLFQGNEAIGGAGGTGANGGAGGVGQGGALANSFCDWDVRDSLFAVNQATGGAGGDNGSGLLGGTGGAGRGGGFANQAGSIGALFDSAVVLNRVTGGAGGLGGNGGVGQGGGVFNGGPAPLGTPSLTLHHTLVALNRADGGAAGEGGSTGVGQGGGLYLTTGGVACADLLTVISANDASSNNDDVFGELGDC